MRNFPVSFGKTPPLGCRTVRGTCSSDIHWLRHMPRIVTRHIPVKHIDITRQISAISFTGVRGPRFLVVFFNVNVLYVTVLIIICRAATQNFNCTGMSRISKFLFALE